MTRKREPYKVPDDMTDERAEELMATLLAEIRVIEADLGDRSRESQPDYERWRHKAKGAWHHKIEEYRALKEWRGKRKSRPTGPVSGSIASAIGRIQEQLDRVRVLEQLEKAARRFMLEDTDEAYDAMCKVVEQLGEGGPSAEG